MKKYFIAVPVLLIIFTGAYLFASYKTSYVIKGKINVESSTIYLKGFRNKMFYILDSSKVVNGQFSFKGSVKLPDLFGLTLDRNESFSPYYIFIENGTIQVEIDTANTRSATITGSESNTLFERYRRVEDGFNIDSLIKAHPKSTVAAYILYRNFSTGLSAKELDANLALFDASLNDLSYLKELRVIVAIKKKLENGSPAIDFSGTTPEGKTIRLSDYYGHYLLLDFWASWCPPCRKESPNLVKIYNKYKGKGFHIFAVSLDQEKESWVKAIASDHLTWSHVSDLKFWDSTPAKIYAIRSIPSNFLIDPTGKIIARNLMGEELDKKLEELFK